MAASRTTAGTFREIWQEATPLAIGGLQTITTGIRTTPARLSNVFGILRAVCVDGSTASVSTSLTSVNGFLQVELVNTSFATITWRLDVSLLHSVQQARELSTQGLIHVIGEGSGVNATVNSIADLRAYTLRPTCIQVLGYYSPGDEGGGLFIWDSTSVAVDNGGTVIEPNSLPVMGRWIRPIEYSLNVRFFGAKGNGVADDYGAIVAAQSVAITRGGEVYFPSGDYGVTQTLLPASGCTWRGDSSYAYPGLPSSHIVLIADIDYLINIQAQQCRLQSLWIDGNHKTNKAVLHFTGLGSTHLCEFVDLCVSNPKLPALGGDGYVLNVAGSSQVDDCVFERCNFVCNPFDGNEKTHTLVHLGQNTNALLNIFRKCVFWGAEYTVRIFAGSATLSDCDFGGVTTACINAEAVALTVERCYTESAGAFFFTQIDLTGLTSKYRTILRDNILNGDGNGISLMCKNPTTLEGNMLSFYVFVEPAVLPNTYRVIAHGNSFTGAVGDFTGSGYPSMVDESDTLLPSNVVRCPKGTPRQRIVTTTPFAVETCSVQELFHTNVGAQIVTLPVEPIDDQHILIKDVSGGASITNAITVNGNGKTIDGAVSKAITIPYGFVQLVFNLALNRWSVISDPRSFELPPYIETTVAYAMSVDDGTINCTANTFDVTLPTAVGIKGRQYVIKNSGSGIITLKTTGGEFIDGVLTATLNTDDSITVQSTNAGWIII